MSRLSYLSAKTKVKSSSIQGRGLFAIEKISKGEVVAVKGGHIFNRRTLSRIAEALGPAEIQIGEDLFAGRMLGDRPPGGLADCFDGLLRAERGGRHAPKRGRRGSVVTVRCFPFTVSVMETSTVSLLWRVSRSQDQ